MLCPAFLQVKIDFFKWCPTIDTCKNWCIFFFFLCCSILSQRSWGLTYVATSPPFWGHHVGWGDHCRGEEGSLGPQIHPVTPCSSPPRPGLPRTLWFKVWLIEIIPWSCFFFFLKKLVFGPEPFWKPPPCPAKKRIVVGRPSSTLSSRHLHLDVRVFVLS